MAIQRARCKRGAHVAPRRRAPERPRETGCVPKPHTNTVEAHANAGNLEADTSAVLMGTSAFAADGQPHLHAARRKAGAEFISGVTIACMCLVALCLTGSYALGVALCCAAVGVFLISRDVLERYGKKQNGSEAGEDSEGKDKSPYIKALGSRIGGVLSGLENWAAGLESRSVCGRGGIESFHLRVCDAVGRVLTLVIRMTRDRLESMLHAAGRPMSLRPEEFLAGIILCGAGGFVLGLTNSVLAGTSWFAVATTAFGLMCPVLWVTGKARERQNRIRKSLPFCIDMLTLTTQAGLDFTTSLSLIVQKQGNENPLAAEFKELLREIGIGKPRKKALEDLDAKVRCDALSPVLNAIMQSDRMGSNLASNLKILSSDLRNKRFHLAEEKAHKVPTKMIFPLALLIFPTVFIVVFGPIALHLIGF